MQNNLPQVIIFQDDEKALNYRYKLPFQLNSSVAVKSIEYDLESLKNSDVNFVGPRPTKDAIYYLHPYKDNDYIHASLGEIYFLKEKLDLYKKVGSLLGAKSISTKVDFTESKEIQVEVDGTLRIKLVKLDAESKQVEQSKYKESLQISDRYILQDNFDLNRNVDELKNMIDTFNLYHELDIISLIEARDSRASGTILTSRHVKSEISSEYNSLEVYA